jgi:hypothetical protein
MCRLWFGECPRHKQSCTNNKLAHEPRGTEPALSDQAKRESRMGGSLVLPREARALTSSTQTGEPPVPREHVRFLHVAS